MTMSGEAAVLDAVQMPGRYQVRVDRSRDSLLTDFGRATLTDRYLMPGEEFQDLFARVASQYGDNQAHAQRLYDYMSKLWFVVHALHADPVERRHHARAADFLLPE
jgi:ribonucleoside-diphosphate reductase alpha chain